MGYLDILTLWYWCQRSRSHTIFNFRYFSDYWELLAETYILDSLENDLSNNI